MTNAAALKPVPDNVSKSRPSGMPFIHSDLDDADLTLEEFRVFAHLSRRMGPVIAADGSVRWVAFPSLNSIAETCFRGTYPEAKITSLRRKAFEALEGLRNRNIIEIEHRSSKTEGQMSNLYFLNEKALWQSASFNREWHPSIRKTRHKKAAPDLPAITPRSPGDLAPTPDLPAITPDPTAIKAPTPDLPAITPRSPGDHKVYPSELNPVIPEEREREAREREEEQQAVENPEPEQAIAPPTQAASTAPLVKPENSGEDDRSAAAPIAIFDAETYDWSQYQDAGDGGSNPKFFGYLVKRTQAYSDRRVKAGKEAIGDAIAYAVTRIQRDGQTLYREFEVAEGLRSPEKKAPARASPREFAWTDWHPEDDTPINLSADLSMAQYCWKELKLTWDDPRWLAWLQQARERSPFEWQSKRSGFAHLPDWALRHLAHDMQIPFGGG